MAIIGTFTHNENGYTGIIRSLAFTASVAIDPIQDKRSEKSPDYRVHCLSTGPGDIGAAWKRQGENGEYLSVRIDDPSFSAPINCRLVKTGSEHDYSLIWERQRHCD